MQALSRDRRSISQHRLNQIPLSLSRAHEPSALPVHDATKMLRSSSVLGPFVDSGGTMNWYDENQDIRKLLSLNAGYWNTLRVVTNQE